uniref:Uncharacterized protein n=1 Tax=Romanomermis culicivorax TaxID=13658 RepID=A0A915JAI2_ROMCU
MELCKLDDLHKFCKFLSHVSPLAVQKEEGKIQILKEMNKSFTKLYMCKTMTKCRNFTYSIYRSANNRINNLNNKFNALINSSKFLAPDFWQGDVVATFLMRAVFFLFEGITSVEKARRSRAGVVYHAIPEAREKVKWWSGKKKLRDLDEGKGVSTLNSNVLHFNEAEQSQDGQSTMI